MKTLHNALGIIICFLSGNLAAKLILDESITQILIGVYVTLVLVYYFINIFIKSHE